VTDNMADRGGGVYAASNGIFNMSGNAKVVDNWANSQGGGVYVAASGGTFNMSGGTVSNNTAGGNVTGSGGGVYAASGTFNMTGGAVSNNVSGNGGGVYINGGTASAISGTATVSSNTAGNGAGLYIYQSTFTMSGTARVWDNHTAVGSGNGGGVFVDGGSNGSSFFTMSENAEVSDNTASNGGGVFVDGSFTMEGGKISDNQADNTTGGGGGVCVANGATAQFTMLDGVISGNSAYYGGGILKQAVGTFYIVNGTIYGSNETNTSLRNTATNDGAAFGKPSGGTAEYGTFTGTGGAWASNGSLSTTTDDTIRVLNGKLVVASEADLRKIGTGGVWYLTAQYIQTANINLTGSWTPIGTSTAGSQFTGSYDGGGHTITGLSITTGGNQGLFGYIGASGKVENLGLVNVSITGNNSNVGGIAGQNNGTIQNCYVTGNITGTGSVGGITGYHEGGTIQNCYVTANVIGNSGNVGGIAGNYNNNPTIKTCVALNESVKNTSSMQAITIGRIFASSTPTGSFANISNNLAWSGMEVVGNSPSAAVVSSLNGVHGQDIATTMVKMQMAWEAVGFNFSTGSPWMWNTQYNRPVLRNEVPQEWPAHLNG